MLKGLDPLLHADLLHALRAMGHGDEIAVVDVNFPAESTAARTVLGTALRLDAADAPRAARAILSVMPLDTFVEAPLARMAVVGAPDDVPSVQREVSAEADRAEGRAIAVEAVERFAFYERAANAYAILQTGERRFYGCFLLKKGVIAPEATP